MSSKKVEPEFEAMAQPVAEHVSKHLYVADSRSEESGLLQLGDVTQTDLQEISELMRALVGLRDAEKLLAEASEKYMKLSSQDMRVLHYLIVAKREGETVTPGMLAKYFKISAASTTKLINRLEVAGHVTRRVHPSDRRAFVIEITAATEVSANETVGKQQAKRFYAAKRLTSEERKTVTRFLIDMTNEISLDNADWV